MFWDICFTSVEIIRRWWKDVRKSLEKHYARGLIPTLQSRQNQKSALLVGVSLSFFFRRACAFVFFATTYTWLSCPSTQTFDKAFREWFHEVYFPRIVQQFHEMWSNDYRKSVKGLEMVHGVAGTIGNAIGNFIHGGGGRQRDAEITKQNSIMSQTNQAPTRADAFKVVEKYETDAIDYLLFKYVEKKGGSFSVTFLGCFSRWYFLQGTVYNEEALAQILQEVQANK